MIHQQKDAEEKRIQEEQTRLAASIRESTEDSNEDKKETGKGGGGLGGLFAVVLVGIIAGAGFYGYKFYLKK